MLIECFNCHAIKNKVWNRSMKETKKMKCSKRIIHRQYLQVSSVRGASFLSHLPKRVTRLYRALHGDAMLVFLPKDTNMAAWNQQEQLELNLRWKHFLFAHELSYMSLIMSSNALMGNLPKITGRDRFLNQTALSWLLSWCYARQKSENSKCCIFKTKNPTEPKTGKKVYF